MTNFERIKAMSVDRMADFLYSSIGSEYCKNACTESFRCYDCLRKWLESEVQDG